MVNENDQGINRSGNGLVKRTANSLEAVVGKGATSEQARDKERKIYQADPHVKFSNDRLWTYGAVSVASGILGALNTYGIAAYYNLPTAGVDDKLFYAVWGITTIAMIIDGLRCKEKSKEYREATKNYTQSIE